MIVVYETSGCLGCRKVKAWLAKNGFEYRSKNIETVKMTEQEIRYLFALAEDVYDLISLRSDTMKNFSRTYHKDFEDLSFNEMVKFVQNHPKALKRPITTDGKRLVVGWDEDEITVFRRRKQQRTF